MDDAAPKIVHVVYPPVDGGPQALIGFTGLAELPDRTRIGDWLRETIRGEDEGFDESVAHVKARLDRDVAPLGHGLTVVMLVVHGDTRYVFEIRNEQKNALGVPVLLPEFQVIGCQVTDWVFGVYGSGARAVKSRGHTQRVQDLLQTRPRNPNDFMKLLATVNRDVASVVSTVSPYCRVEFLPTKSETFGPASTVFLNRGESVPLAVPFIAFGIDFQPSILQQHEQLRAMMAGQLPTGPSPSDSIKAGLRRRE